MSEFQLNTIEEAIEVVENFNRIKPDNTITNFNQ